MARPTEDEVFDALMVLSELVAVSHEELLSGYPQEAMPILRAAVKPRPVWPVKEVAEYLDVRPENVRPEKLRGLPQPAQEFPRPTVRHPEKTMRLFYADEIEAYRLVLDATARRRNAREKAAKS
jgi:hypothetical protein